MFGHRGLLARWPADCIPKMLFVTIINKKAVTNVIIIA